MSNAVVSWPASFFLVFLIIVSHIRWPKRLGELFEKVGFQHVSHSTYETSPELRGFFTQIHLMLAEEISLTVMDNSRPDGSGPTHRKHIQEAAREAEEGAALHFTPVVTIGQKPA